MRYVSPWYRSAYAAVEAAVSPLTAADGVKRIRKVAKDAYPFGARDHWPYKQYLKARRVCLYHRFPTLFPRPRELDGRRAYRAAPADVSGQLELFPDASNEPATVPANPQVV